MVKHTQKIRRQQQFPVLPLFPFGSFERLALEELRPCEISKKTIYHSCLTRSNYVSKLFYTASYHLLSNRHSHACSTSTIETLENGVKYAQN